MSRKVDVVTYVLCFLLLMVATCAHVLEHSVRLSYSTDNGNLLKAKVVNKDRQLSRLIRSSGVGECGCDDSQFSTGLQNSQLVLAAKVLSVHYVPDFTDGGPSPQYPLAEYTLQPLIYYKNRSVISSPTFQVYASVDPKKCVVRFGIGEQWLFLLSGRMARGGRYTVGHCDGNRKWKDVPEWERKLLRTLKEQESA